MNHHLCRRQFGLESSALIGGLFVNGSQQSFANESAVRDNRLVLLGLNALARAPEMNYFADGHRGAAMISAHMMCLDNDLDAALTARIAELFDLNWARSKLCSPFPASDRVEDATKRIGMALAEGRGVLREVGHDAIFAMHAIKGFRLLPESATPERVQGVCNLIRSIKPWRDDAPDVDIDPPPFIDGAAASRFVLKETSDAIDRFAGFGQGFAGHMLTFGQALIELAATGDEQWAESCRLAFRKYVTVTRKGPQAGDRKIKDHPFEKLRPSDTEYWKNRGDKTLGIGHVFKYPYAYYDLLKRANDPKLEKDLDSKAWKLF